MTAGEAAVLSMLREYPGVDVEVGPRTEVVARRPWPPSDEHVDPSSWPLVPTVESKTTRRLVKIGWVSIDVAGCASASSINCDAMAVNVGRGRLSFTCVAPPARARRRPRVTGAPHGRWPGGDVTGEREDGPVNLRARRRRRTETRHARRVGS